MAKDSEIKPHPLCLGNLSKDLTVNNKKKTKLNEYEYDFYFDCNTIDVSGIVNICKYLLKKLMFLSRFSRSLPCVAKVGLCRLSKMHISKQWTLLLSIYG